MVAHSVCVHTLPVSWGFMHFFIKLEQMTNASSDRETDGVKKSKTDRLSISPMGYGRLWFARSIVVRWRRRTLSHIGSVDIQ